MIDLVRNQTPALSKLCHDYQVERLDIFGSAAKGTFDPGRSDLDFLVRFHERNPTGEYAERYLDFADALERLFQRRVDLVTEHSIRNPFLHREVENTREVVYERHGYDTIDDATVWGIAADHLPKLIAEIDLLIAAQK
jgi:predicted nucleotidyltransferase